MISARATSWPASGAQPSSVVSSVTPAPISEAPGHRGDGGVAEPAPRCKRVVHRRRLVPAVHHAVAALLVPAPPPVVLPARGLEQLLEARRVSLLEEVAGPLPAEDVEGRVTPRRALEVLLAHQELEKQRRLVETAAPLRIREDRREEVVRALGAQEVLLIGRLGVAVARRDHHALDAEIHHLVEELAHAGRVGAVEQRGVGRYPEAAAQRLADALQRLVEDPIAA